MVSSTQEDLASDRFRPPDWRLLEARRLVSGPGGPRADEWSHRAAWYLEDLADGRQLRYHTHIYEAFRLHEDASAAMEGEAVTGLAAAALELEAYMLAGQSPAAAASHVGQIDPRVGEAYAALFFDVSTRLKSVAWVCGSVLGQLTGGSPDSMPAKLARAYGYFTRSKKAVRWIMSGIDGISLRSAVANGMDGLINADTSSSLGYKSVLIARTMPAEKRALRTAVEMYAKVNEVMGAAREAIGDAEAVDYRKALDSLKSSFVFGFGEDPVTKDAPRLAQIATAGVNSSTATE